MLAGRNSGTMTKPPQENTRTDQLPNLRIVIPVYNDWRSFSILLSELDKEAHRIPFEIFVTAIDDGSSEDALEAVAMAASLSHLRGVEILHLAVNLGHQRAIAVGLCVAVKDDTADAILIMDADGEDPPQSIPTLIAGIHGRTTYCLVARRRKRTEKLSFRTAYFIYKNMFRTVTGKSLAFGNFSLFSRNSAKRLVMVSDLWNNLPAAVLRSKLQFQEVSIDRGRRYSGSSKMNFTSLVMHGMSGISVHADTIFVRLLILTMLLLVFGTLAIVAVLVLRLLSPAHATPGWATTVTLGVIIIITQLFVTTLSSILMLLNNRVQRLVVPFVHYQPYVESRELISGSPFTRRAELS